jgi:hypothetical protein
MSLFIAVENQNLLYEMIHKTNDIYTVFPQGSPPATKNEWFRMCIENAYRQMPPIITREQLKTINRQVLATMVSSLRELVTKTLSTPLINKDAIQPKYNTLKREHAPEYESKEAQYKSLFDVPKPQVIDFSEKIEDEVITNMSELIEQQKRMRERELQEYAPMPVNYGENIKVSILEDVPKDALQPTVISEKRVTFSETNHNEIPSNEIPLLPSVYNELKEKIDGMDNKINEMYKMIQSLVKPELDVENNISKLKEIIKIDE